MGKQAALALADRRDGTMVVQCFAQSDGELWEGFCIDFDLAVQGGSFEEVQESLHKAILMYVNSAIAEDSWDDRVRLFTRRAPLAVRLKWAFRQARAALARRKPGATHQEVAMGFPVSCPV
jgi:hypothetical protein